MNAYVPQYVCLVFKVSQILSFCFLSSNMLPLLGHTQFFSLPLWNPALSPAQRATKMWCIVHLFILKAKYWSSSLLFVKRVIKWERNRLKFLLVKFSLSLSPQVINYSDSPFASALINAHFGGNISHLLCLLRRAYSVVGISAKYILEWFELHWTMHLPIFRLLQPVFNKVNMACSSVVRPAKIHK